MRTNGLQDGAAQEGDPASLDRLHDLVLPEPIPWWPPAPGWIVLSSIALLALLFLAWRAWRGWRRNAYRRAALAELERIGADGGASLGALPALLKRTALAAYERAEVAPLSGEPWLAFLDEKIAADRFARGPGRCLSELAYRPGAADELDERSARELLDLARHWIRRHRTSPC